MRVFLAVSGGEPFHRALTTALDGWRAGGAGRLKVRWTRPETWHLTLQFLGDWPEDRLEGLKSALEEARDQAPFVLTPGRVGGFPDLKRPRVLFLHMDDDGQAAALAGRIRKSVGEFWPDGPQDTRPFQSHLTLARIRESLSRADVKLFQEMELGDLSPIMVEGFHLLASERRPAGPRYETLAFFPLRK